MKLTTLIMLCASVALGSNIENPTLVRERNREAALAADPLAAVPWSAVTNDLLRVATQLNAIDVSTIDATAWSAAQRAEVEDLKALLSSLKAACQDLEQGVTRAVRKIQRTEELNP